MRDLRDPEKLWGTIQKFRVPGAPANWGLLCVIPSPNYTDGGHISNDPANHHSKTPQDVPVEEA